MGRTQRVCLDSSLASTKMLNGGIPEGTRLGSILFAVMVDDLLTYWGPRVKFVDDLTVLEIVPRPFLHYDSSVWPPLFLAGAEIDSVGSLKFLGIYF